MNQQKRQRYDGVCWGAIISSCRLKVKKTFWTLLKVETNRTVMFLSSKEMVSNYSMDMCENVIHK